MDFYVCAGCLNRNSLIFSIFLLSSGMKFIIRLQNQTFLAIFIFGLFQPLLEVIQKLFLLRLTLWLLVGHFDALMKCYHHAWNEFWMLGNLWKIALFSKLQPQFDFGLNWGCFEVRQNILKLYCNQNECINGLSKFGSWIYLSRTGKNIILFTTG